MSFELPKFNKSPKEGLKKKKVIRISSSSLNDFLSCPKKFKYQRIDTLKPVLRGVVEITDTKGAPMDKGDFLHVLLRIYYRCLIHKLKKKESSDLSKLFGRGYAPTTRLPISVTEYLIDIFDEYVKNYVNDLWKPIAVEEPFSMIFHEDDEIKILYEGVIDLDVNVDDEFNMPVDHKSHGSYTYTKEMGNQFKAYCHARRSKRLCINKLFLQKDTKGKERFSRSYVTFSPTEIVDWIDDTVYWIKLLAQFLISDFFPKNETDCYSYGKCAFIPLCKASPRMIEYIARRDFEKIEEIDLRRWDPQEAIKRNREELAWIKQHA